MAEDKKQVPVNTDQAAAKTVAEDIYGGKKKGGARPPFRRNERGRDDRPKDEFEQRILDIARVTRVMAGGKRMNFRACVAIGDKKGKISVGVGKGADVTMAVNKAVNRAKKDMTIVPIVNETLPHSILEINGASRILFKPAKKGKGVIAGGVVRVLLELAGVKNATSKILGGKNKINNARCTIEAFKKMKKAETKAEKKANKIEENKK